MQIHLLISYVRPEYTDVSVRFELAGRSESGMSVLAHHRSGHLILCVYSDAHGGLVEEPPQRRGDTNISGSCASLACAQESDGDARIPRC